MAVWPVAWDGSRSSSDRWPQLKWCELVWETAGMRSLRRWRWISDVLSRHSGSATSFHTPSRHNIAISIASALLTLLTAARWAAEARTALQAQQPQLGASTRAAQPGHEAARATAGGRHFPPPPPFAAAGTRWCPYTGGGPGAARPGREANLGAAMARGCGESGIRGLLPRGTALVLCRQI